MDIYRVQTGTKYGTLFANDDDNLAELKSWFLTQVKADLEEDSTLTDSVIDQTMANWQNTFDELSKTISYEATDEGLCESLAGGYVAAGGNIIINKSMGLEAWS